MSKIIPVSITTTEQAVTLDATYQFVWLRNMGENDCLLSDHSGIVAGDDNVTLVKAGESGRIATSGRAVYIKAVSGTTAGEIHAQNFSDAPFRSKAKGGGQSITVEPLTVNDNGVYTAPTGKAYSPVSVDVQEQPWQPLQDGYSNFWFELTNDTLSPWLNFGTITTTAMIDWGDGSGEQILNTSHPTHTYAKAGKYVVKVKGVWGLAQQHTDPYQGEYLAVLKAIETNNEITELAASTFVREVGLKNIYIPNVNTIYNYAFYLNASLTNLVMPKVSNVGGQPFFQCASLEKITFPNTCTSMGNYCFYECRALKEIHMQASVPPTIGTNIFQYLASNFIIYVPTGYGETYKTASGWSDYADHILEEGQQPNRAMLAKFNEETDEPQDDMR